MPKKKRLADVFRGDLWGSRESKYAALWEKPLISSDWIKLPVTSPYYMFSVVEDDLKSIYDQGFALNELFSASCTGIITARDDLTIDFNVEELRKKIEFFLDARNNDDEVRDHFFPNKKPGKYLAGDSRGWRLSEARGKLRGRPLDDRYVPIEYRPFDQRAILYDADIIDWGREEVMRSMIGNENLALLSPRMTADNYSPFVTSRIISNKTASRYDQTYFFPLYINSVEGGLGTGRQLNFDKRIFAKILKAAGLKGKDSDEILVFDYIYGVLHSPSYRERYASFLKVDFPRIPFPSSPDNFRDVSEKGEALRRLHLMESEAVGATPYPFEGGGDSKVDKPRYESSRVWINDTQYFANVPAVAWDFLIGGYQPLQKWLKDRKGRAIDWNDVRHYQKIIKILAETDRLMSEINLPD